MFGARVGVRVNADRSSSAHARHESTLSRARQALCEFLSQLTVERTEEDRPYVGLIYWGPLLGWAWMMGRSFSQRSGYLAPELMGGDWHQIAEDAITGIQRIGALLLGLSFDLVCGPLWTYVHC